MAELPKFQSGQPLEDQITADRMNAIVSAVNANNLNQGTGIRITRNNSGTTISTVKSRSALDIRPFTPTLSKEDNGDYKVRITKGFIVEIQLSATESLVYHEPSDIYESDAFVYQDITLGQAGYIEAEVGLNGKITGTPIFLIDNDDAESIHYFPVIGDYIGLAGTVRYKLFVLNSTTGTIEKVLSGQNLLHYAERFTMANLTSGSGTTYKVLKDYDPSTDTVNFRTLSQLGGSSEPLIVAGATDSIEFKGIKQRDTDPQVMVSTDGDDILVQGNGVDGDNGAVTVVDGLVTVIKTLTIDDGQDLDLVTWEFVMTVDAGYLVFDSSTQTTVDCWRLGIYVGSFSYGATLPAASGGGVVLTTRDVSFVTVSI
jgi:hypothetical protein